MGTSSPRLLTVGGHTIAAIGFNEALSNTPLVFIHGVTSSVHFWSDGGPMLASRRWYSLGLPGHYPSAFPPGFQPAALTPELVADLTACAIQQLVGDRPVILAGHSTGGFATLATAARHPERVKAAISIAGFARGYWTGPLRMLQLQSRAGRVGEALFKMSMRGVISSPWSFKLSASFDAADRRAYYNFPGFDQILAPQYADAAQLDLDAMLAYFSRMPDIDITPWLPRIQAPLLVVAGDRDPIVPPQQARLIADRVPCSTLHMIKGSGHLPIVERPAEYHAVIGGWIDQCI